jgi:GNAT superfamily N-acetyltransferase
MLAESLADTDMAAIVSISGKINSGLTTDRAQLQAAIMEMQAQNLYRMTGSDCPNIDYYHADLIESKHNSNALEAAIHAWRNPSPLATTSTWIAWRDEGKQVVGRGQLVLPTSGANEHLGQASIEVLPEARRQHIARTLLTAIAVALRDSGRTALIVKTTDRVPAGARFMERLGAEAGLAAHAHQLAISDLDPERIARWRAAGPHADYELVVWEGAYPEADLEAIATLTEVMNTQPLGGLAVEAQPVTPALLRQIEVALATRSAERWTVSARARSTGRLAGFTEAMWMPGTPRVLHQLNTGVMPEHRGRGLARWLKAEMLGQVPPRRPEIRFVRTSNADSNAAMLSVNAEMGFKPYESWTVWQVTLERVEAYLSRT